MALNIFPRRRETTTATIEAQAEPEAQPLPEPTPEAIDDAAGARRTRRGSRGGRGRGRGATTTALDTDMEAAGDQPTAVAPTSPAPDLDAGAPFPADAAPAARRRRRPTAAAVAAAAAELEAAITLPVDLAPDTESAPAPAARREATRSRSRAAAPAPEPAIEPEHPARGRDTGGRDGGGGERVPSLAPLVHAIEAQSRQLDQLVTALQQGTPRGGRSGPAEAAAPPVRVGVFVDAANVELAFDRLRARADWGRILGMLLHGRHLVRAVAYSPVHDDPGVSRETQRFVEPFLDKGFKVVTKPLKRFQDGTVKANVDIEMAVDVISALDRLDVVCLVSGDGDFVRLVEFVQSHGVRVEIASVAQATAGELRHAADEFIDLGARMRDLR